MDYGRTQTFCLTDFTRQKGIIPKTNNNMSYKKNDILIFMTKEPQAHVCEMFGHGTIKAVDIECEPYYGFVKSVISASKGIYLMQTIKPIEGFICVAEKADIIRMAEKDELPETECVRKSPEWLEAPNVYVPVQNVAHTALTEEERCIALAKEALQHLFPEIPATEFELRSDWFLKSGFISTLNYFDDYLQKISDSARRDELCQMKNEIRKDLQKARFKEYYSVNVGYDIENGTAYFIVAVSKEFDEVCILRDINDRSNFFRSLGPEFVDLSHAVDHYRDKVLEVAFPKSTTTKNK